MHRLHELNVCLRRGPRTAAGGTGASPVDLRERGARSTQRADSNDESYWRRSDVGHRSRSVPGSTGHRIAFVSKVHVTR